MASDPITDPNRVVFCECGREAVHEVKYPEGGGIEYFCRKHRPGVS